MSRDKSRASKLSPKRASKLSPKRASKLSPKRASKRSPKRASKRATRHTLRSKKHVWRGDEYELSEVMVYEALQPLNQLEQLNERLKTAYDGFGLRFDEPRIEFHNTSDPELIKRVLTEVNDWYSENDNINYERVGEAIIGKGMQSSDDALFHSSMESILKAEEPFHLFPNDSANNYIQYVPPDNPPVEKGSSEVRMYYKVSETTPLEIVFVCTPSAQTAARPPSPMLPNKLEFQD